MSRNLERSIARTLYAKFSKKWRQEKRLAGVYGQPGYKRPKFNEWYQLHQQHVLEAAREHIPAVENNYESDGSDPWAEQDVQRGAVTIDIATGEEEGNG